MIIITATAIILYPLNIPKISILQKEFSIFSLYQKPIPKSNSRTLRSPQRVPTCINISTHTTPPPSNEKRTKKKKKKNANASREETRLIPAINNSRLNRGPRYFISASMNVEPSHPTDNSHLSPSPPQRYAPASSPRDETNLLLIGGRVTVPRPCKPRGHPRWPRAGDVRGSGHVSACFDHRGGLGPGSTPRVNG